MFTRIMTLMTLSAMVCVAGQPTHAAEQVVSVVAVGEVKAKPDTVVFTGIITESSQKMKDAVTAFRDTRRRSLAAVEGLEIENLSVSTGALSMSVAGNMAQADPFGGEAKPMPEGTLTLTQSVSLTVTGLDKMEDQAVIDLVVGIIEAAREAGIKQAQTDQEMMMMMRMGLGMPESSAAFFRISDPEAVRRKATKAAMDKARADAQFLAELAGGKLGRVVSISDAAAVSDESGAMNPYAMIFGMMMDEQGGEFESTSLEPITVVRGLNVTFELITE